MAEKRTIRIAAAGDVHASEAHRERVEAAFAEIEGEPPGIWTYLGCGRLGIPIAEYRPDLVLHGHAHAGSFESAIAETPVYNVAVHVTGRDFYVFELEATPGRSEVEVDAPPA